MGIAFDIQEYWDLSDAHSALESALHDSSDRIGEFETAFADFVGGLDAAFLISGREALYRALNLIGVQPGDQVILSAFNCSRVADAVLRCSAVPVLVDVELPGGEMDLDLVLRSLTPRVRAVVIPHLYGIPVDFRRVKDELEERGVVVIEDCAHCLGASIGTSSAGSLGAYSIFSFNTGKPITLGNGGMLVCSDASLLEGFKRQKAHMKDHFSADARGEFEYIEQTLEAMASLRRGASQGHLPRKPTSLKGRLVRSRPGIAGLWLYNRLQPVAPLAHPFNDEFSPVGPVRATLGLCLLSQWPRIKAVRNRQAEYLRRWLRQWRWGQVSEVPPDIRPAYYKVNVFAAALTARQVEQAIARLRSAGFWAGRWPFLSHVPHLVGRFRNRYSLPNMRKMAVHGLHLPVHQDTSSADLDHMLAILQSVQA